MTEQADPRSAPTAAFIDDIRKRFPTEREIDAVMTRKMELRSGPGYRPITLEEIVERLRALIASDYKGDFTIHNARWLQGGASKIQIAFDLEWNGFEQGETRRTPMALRMQPPESIVETSRRREFEAIKAMDSAIPVPACYWLDPDGSHLPEPAIVYGFVNGVTRPSKNPSKQVTGIGTNYGPELRPIIADQFIEAMARVHTPTPEQIAKLTSFDVPQTGSTEAMVKQVNWWRRVWEEDRPVEEPLINVAYNWLIENAVPLDHVSLVHGDFRAGNFLYDEATNKITTWLDWELAVLGDRHQDLCWTTGAHFGHYAEDGKTFLACGLLPTDEFLERYEKASGLTVDPFRLKYFRVFNDFMSTITMHATGWRTARLGKTHQDVTVAWLAMIGNGIAASLCSTLEEVL